MNRNRAIAIAANSEMISDRTTEETVTVRELRTNVQKPGLSSARVKFSRLIGQGMNFGTALRMSDRSLSAVATIQ